VTGSPPDAPRPGSPQEAIYRRWRAQRFAEIVGQEAVVETLRNAVRSGRVSHAILFAGPRGTGKTSLARILAKAINCTDLRDGDACDACPSCVAIREGRALDLVEIDAASNRGIDAIRDLRERINYAPADLRRKVYILDEAHQVTRDAWNALLKSLEEPPPSVVFMFASTHPLDFPPAILSRLQRFDVRRLTVAEIEGKLRRILAADGWTAEPGAIRLIARLAAGGMRDAESMLDQLLSAAPEQLDESRVRRLLGLAESDVIDRFIDALVARDVLSGIALLDDLDDRGRDLRAFLDQLVEALRLELVAAAARPAAGRHPLAEIASVARRLASLDPDRGGGGGLRLQLELSLLPDWGSTDAVPATAVAPTATAAATERFSATERTAAPAPVEVESTAPTGADAKPSADATSSVATAAPTPRRPRRAIDAPAPHSSADATPPASAVMPVAPVPMVADPTPPPHVAESGAAADLARLRDRWSEVVTALSAHPPTKPLITVCRPMSIENGRVTLGFPEGMGFLKDVAERRRSVLEEGIGRLLGQPVTVRCIATNLEAVGTQLSDEDAAYLVAEATRIFAEEPRDVPEVS